MRTATSTFASNIKISARARGFLGVLKGICAPGAWGDSNPRTLLPAADRTVEAAPEERWLEGDGSRTPLKRRAFSLESGQVPGARPRG
jgi:hypothetical protein